MLKLLRYYVLASLVAVLATAALLTWYYRQVAIQGIVQLVEQSSLVLTRTALSPIRPALVDFLQASSGLRTTAVHPLQDTLHPSLPPEVVETIKLLMRDRSIARIKIYNRNGIVAFSTKTSQIGRDQRDNPGVISALNGRVAHTLIYRDTFNGFDGESEEDNLMQTYIPIRASPAEPIEGVFELYADVNRLVLEIEHTEFVIMAGSLLIMSVLYAVLILIMRHAGKLVESQQRTIRERTETLELLSSQMLKNEESNRKKIATELHEGLAQTLAALKLKVETGWHLRDGNVAGESADSIIPVLQQAIHEVRTIAMDLRPPSLDDFGLLPTLDWFCREFQQQHAGMRVEQQIGVQEHDIPSSLKTVVYRIVVSVLADMAQQTNTNRIHLALWRDRHTLTLLIDDTPSDASDRTAISLVNIDPQACAGFARMEELTTLSGGEFSASYHVAGGTTLRASWDVKARNRG
jgi:signal transduction histidine kinase